MWSKLCLITFLAGFSLLLYGTFKALTLPPLSPVAGEIVENYRIVFFHVPSAISSFIAFTLTFFFSAIFLKTENYKRDLQAVSSAKFGFAMITAALISGSIWAKVAWGSYWNWDPRETFVLILWFAYAAYFAIRSSIEDYSIKAKYSAIYSLFAFITVPMSYFSAKISVLHPTTSELRFDAERGLLLGIMIVAFILIYTAYFFIDSKISEIEERVGVVE